MTVSINQLHNYGIQTEECDLRAHVAPLAKVCFVFPRICGVRAMQHGLRKEVFVDGSDEPCAVGYIVSPKLIERMQRIPLTDQMLKGFHPRLSTSEKGKLAAEVVEQLLAERKIQLWENGILISDKKIQIRGMDILVPPTNIEVKCDYKASDEPGVPHPLCSGSLFLQIAERNPNQMH